MILIFFVLAAPIPSFALETYQEGAVLFSDDFSDGNLDGWRIEEGNWRVDGDKVLKAQTIGQLMGGRITASSDPWDNYKIEADIKVDSGIDVGVGFRRRDTVSFYEINLRYGTGAFDTPEIKLFKGDGGSFGVLKSTHLQPLNNNQWYHLKIEVFEEHIQVFIDQNIVFDFDDKGTNVKKGVISLAQWTGAVGIIDAKFDNIKVTQIGKLRFPVIFIPGIGGSELKASRDIFWMDQDNGHGGSFSRLYKKDEKIWVNEEEARNLGHDDYFDVLRMDERGTASQADISLTGSLTPFGYGSIDPFFEGIGYLKDYNFFIFPYDWRKDVRENKEALDKLVEETKAKSGQPKVNLVVHSMGGLIARDYISDQGRAGKVHKLIELGVPHVGTVKGLKTIVYGNAVEKNIIFNLIPIGIPASEVKDVFQNLPSAFQLIPSKTYYDFYTDLSPDLPYPFKDSRDIDKNNTAGALNFSDLKQLIFNLGLNQIVFSLGEKFHDFIDAFLDKPAGVKLYEIVGSGQPTLGQLHETWWVTWPVKIFDKTDEVFINGDGTIPLYSASLKSSAKDLSGGARIYYTQQEHTDLARKDGEAMEIVRQILMEGDTFPAGVKDAKFNLEGSQISLDDGEIDLFDEEGNHTGLDQNGQLEQNIPGTLYSKTKKSKHVFVKKTAKKIRAKIKKALEEGSQPKTNIKIYSFEEDKVSTVSFFKDTPLSNTPSEIILPPNSPNPPNPLTPLILSPEGKEIPPTSETQSSSGLDQIPPKTKITLTGDNPVTVILTGSDSESGILNTEYSLDNGVTVNTYTQPFIITTPGTTTLQVKSIDKLGNEEIPQELKIEVTNPSPNPLNTLSSAFTTLTSNIQLQSPASIFQYPASSTSPEILGLRKQTPFTNNHERITNNQLTNNQNRLFSIIILGLSLGLILAVALIVSLVKNPPKNMDHPKPE